MAAEMHHGAFKMASSISKDCFLFFRFVTFTINLEYLLELAATCNIIGVNILCCCVVVVIIVATVEDPLSWSKTQRIKSSNSFIPKAFWVFSRLTLYFRGNQSRLLEQF